MLRFFVVALCTFASTTKQLVSGFLFFILGKSIANTSQFSINQHKMNSLFFCRSSFLNTIQEGVPKMLGAPSAVFSVLISYSPPFPTSLFSLPPISIWEDMRQKWGK